VINNKYSTKLSQAFLGCKYEECIKTYYLDELMKISVQMSLDQKDNNYKCLVDINAKYNLLCDLQNENVILMRNAQRAKVLFDSYVNAQTETLNEMYDSIQDRFSELYKIIHSSDESSFSGELNRKAAALELRVQFKDGNMYPPNAVHSEGHQDSMGICLFFALSEKISNSKLNLVLLDDVVMSIDIDHRKNFCKLLKEQFPNKQFIITTHDYIWRKELESQGVIQKKNVIHFKAWNIEHGPYVETGSNIWDAINQHLTKGNKSEAIGLMRYYMEEFFSGICEKYGLLVPYSTSGRWTLENVSAPVNAFYRKAIGMAKSSALSYHRPTERIDEFKHSFEQACKELKINQWMINTNTHFNVWAQGFSVDELKSLCKAVKKYCDLFECPECNGLITVESKNLEPQRIFCNCGNFSFSCISKKKE
jgi:SMC domain protein